MKNKLCPAMWLSGFFGFGSLVHLIRFIFGVSLSVGGFDVTSRLSLTVAVILGVLSVVLLVLSLKRPCDKDETHGSCCK